MFGDVVLFFWDGESRALQVTSGVGGANATAERLDLKINTAPIYPVTIYLSDRQT